MNGPATVQSLDRLTREQDNFRSVLRWTSENSNTELGLRLATALRNFWLTRGHPSEGREWFRKLLAATPGGLDGDGGGTTAVVWVRALNAAGVFARWHMEVVQANNLLHHALTLARQVGDHREEAEALTHLGAVAYGTGDVQKAAAFWEEGLTAARRANDSRLTALLLNDFCAIAESQGDLERAKALAEEALVLSRQSANQRGIALQLVNLAYLACKQGDLERASTMGKESLKLARDLGQPRSIVQALEALAWVAAVRDQGEQAAQLLGAAAGLRHEYAAPMYPNELAEVNGREFGIS